MKKLFLFLLFIVATFSLSAQSKIACGDTHTLMIRGDGTLWAWGSNSQGELGNGTTTTNTTPNAAPVEIGTDNNWASVNAGYLSSMAIKTDGTLWGWGFNYYGQLGNGTNTNQLVPVQIGNSNNWIKADFGFQHTVALQSNGTVWAWGYNLYGQLGDGTAIDRNTPQQIGTLTSYTDISAGGWSTYAVKSNGTVWACGDNGYGQLGDGTFITRSLFVQVPGITSAAKVAAGSFYTLALLANGTVRGWGINGSGELGDGSNTYSVVPVVMTGVNTATKIASGGHHSIILLANGTLRTCGSNINGELGDGTNTNRNIAVIASGVTNVQDIAGGYSSGAGGERFSGVIKSTNTSMACMTGANNLGQLGDGATTNRNTFGCVAVGPTTLATSPILGSPFCAGVNVNVTYTVAGNINAGNIFTAQLSDAAGSFTSPTNIGTITSLNSGTISATLPAATSTGTQYRIRVVGSNPSTIGTDNGNNLTINTSQTWYLDVDNDQYYISAQTTCTNPGAGWHLAPVIAAGDCDDNNATIYPGTTRPCYTGASGTAGVGACNAGIQTCMGLGMWGACTGQVVPTTEVCNGVDDNCNGTTDEGFSPSTYYLDADNDQYYASSQIACASPGVGWHHAPVTGGGDCNDNDASIHPGVTEICNNMDDNCDGITDEGFNPVTYYYDNDGDNYGATIFSFRTCDPPPPHFVVTPGDCDDSNNAIWPNSPEASNCIDDNCNGLIDEGVVPTTWYFDNDGDNYGSSPTIQNCAQPMGYVLSGGDCDDNNNLVWPNQTEIVNGIDDNCNGQIDEGFIILNLKVFIEGLYAGNGIMQPSQFNAGVSMNQNLADVITVKLYDPYDLSTIVSTQTVNLGVDGNASVPFPANLIGGEYYIAIYHRNSIETWSKLPVTFNGSIIYFDFSTP